MKQEKLLHNIWGDQLQRQMDEDYSALITEEQMRYTYMGTQKIHPAYEMGNVFSDHADMHRQKQMMRAADEKRRNSIVIQPNDPNKKTIVVIPNE